MISTMNPPLTHSQATNNSTGATTSTTNTNSSSTGSSPPKHNNHLMNASSSSDPSSQDELAIAHHALEAAEEQLQSLCASHAGTFVAVERRARLMEEALQEALRRIQQASDDVNDAQFILEQDDKTQDSDSNSTTTTLAQLSEKHRLRRRTLLQHSSLLELLELPSLMDACLRSNLYEDALNVAAFANTLQRRHSNHPQQQQPSSSHNNNIVQRVIGQIRARQTDLRQQLLLTLKGNNVTMPQCLEVVTALRRLNSIQLEQMSHNHNNNATYLQQKTNLEDIHSRMELQLQVDFLEARDSWMSSHDKTTTTTATTQTMHLHYLDHPPQESNNNTNTNNNIQEQQLLDTIERHRTRLFEIATQFNAIFRASIKTDSNNHHDNTLQTMAVSLLNMWTSRRIQTFLTTLCQQLDEIQGRALYQHNSSLTTTDAVTTLRDALEATVFFSTSMGRLGADFTAQLGPVFEPRMLRLIVTPWKTEGVQPLEETLKVCRDAGVAHPLMIEAGAANLGADGIDAAGAYPENLPLHEPHPPPRYPLLQVPPLARLVNAILNSLNDLRRCLLPGIFSALRKELDALLEEVRNILQTNDRIVHAPGLRGQAAALREAAGTLRSLFDRVVEPYLRGSLEAAIGHREGAAKYHTILRENLKAMDQKSTEESEDVDDQATAEEEAPAQGENEGWAEEDVGMDSAE